MQSGKSSTEALKPASSSKYFIFQLLERLHRWKQKETEYSTSASWKVFYSAILYNKIKILLTLTEQPFFQIKSILMFLINISICIFEDLNLGYGHEQNTNIDYCMERKVWKNKPRKVCEEKSAASQACKK